MPFRKLLFFIRKIASSLKALMLCSKKLRWKSLVMSILVSNWLRADFWTKMHSNLQLDTSIYVCAYQDPWAPWKTKILINSLERYLSVLFNKEKITTLKIKYEKYLNLSNYSVRAIVGSSSYRSKNCNRAKFKLWVNPSALPSLVWLQRNIFCRLGKKSNFMFYNF